MTLVGFAGLGFTGIAGQERAAQGSLRSARDGRRPEEVTLDEVARFGHRPARSARRVGVIRSPAGLHSPVRRTLHKAWPCHQASNNRLDDLKPR
jgi:hypothetical protein